MFTAILNIVLGSVLIVGALTGEFTLLGTESRGAMIAIGALVTAVGILHFCKRMRPKPQRTGQTLPPEN